MNSAKLTVNLGGDEKSMDLPVLIGTEAEVALDIRNLRQQLGVIVLDPAYGNTGSCTSAITYIDGEKGILRYRGIPIEQLGEKSTFVEVSYLLINGRLPNKHELSEYSRKLTMHSLIHEDMKHFFDGYPATAHPMAILSAMVCSLSSFYPEALDATNTEVFDITATRLLSKLRTIAAFSYKKSIGQPFMYPKNELSYCANLIHMMFATPCEPYPIDDDIVKVINLLLILHADHEQNCSTSTVRLVGSGQANLFASIASGICALWGPRHGGANQEVITMLAQIRKNGDDVNKFLTLVKDRQSGVKLMGFGHRVYKNFDPRAVLIKSAADKVLSKLGRNDPLLETAKRLEEAALKDSYFVDRRLYPNVDFYSGIIYRALGFATNMFTVLFALGRLPGWIAQWKEMNEDPSTRIGRPRQVYTGNTALDYTPIDQRE
ncbi:MAG: citrate synthase [Myxococcales bacterium]|nr:citrate synthase [Myxococcales bacterium]